MDRASGIPEIFVSIFERIADHRKAVGVRGRFRRPTHWQASFEAAFSANYQSFDALTRLPRLAFR
jgi:hypothetical protein